MKKKISLLLAAIMVVGMIPATAFAVTTNTVSKIVTGSEDGLTYTVADTVAPIVAVESDILTAPILKMAEKNLTEYYFGNAGAVEQEIQGSTATSVTFKATLTNAEFSFVYNNAGDTIGVGETEVIQSSTGDIEVSMLTANSAMITAEVAEDGGEGMIKFPIAAELTSDGEATITIDALNSVLTSGTYKFANVVDGATTTTIEKKTDLPEAGATIKPIVITETAAGSLEGSTDGYFKLKLTNGFTFANAGLDEAFGAVGGVTGLSVTDYPELGTWTVAVDEDAQELYLKSTVLAGNDYSTEKAATISISGLKVAYDSDDVDASDVAEITIDGYEMTKATVEVGTAVSYGVTVEAENKTLPTFVAGRYDADEETLKVTMQETIRGSWLDGRKTTITFPEGIKATVESEVIKDGFTESTVELVEDQKADTTVFTFPTDLTRETTDKAKMEFKFNISADPSFTGDVVATFGGAGLEADMDVVIGTVVAPITVTADTNDVSIGYRNVAVGDIIITETEAGYLKKGTKLYLGLENLDFDGTPTVEVVEGDIKIDKVKVVDGDNDNGDTIEITIKTASQKTPAVLKVTGNELYLGRSIPAGAYALTLEANGVADVTPVNAIFQNFEDPAKTTTGFDTDEVVVLKNFVNVVTAGRDRDDSTFTTKLTVTIGADKLVAGTTEIALDVPAYIANGYTMLPVRGVTEALSSVAIVRWDDATKTVTITFGARVVSMTVGSKTMNINGVPVQMQAACEITDSRAFIPLRDLGYALGLNDSKINWDDTTKTATLN
jgi:Copper amine oxidase N-terminal domain.